MAVNFQFQPVLKLPEYLKDFLKNSSHIEILDFAYKNAMELEGDLINSFLPFQGMKIVLNCYLNTIHLHT